MVKFIVIFACMLLIIICGIVIWPTPPEPICIVCGGRVSQIGEILSWLGLLTGIAGLGVQLRGGVG
ncbi:MAG: hypothetical protein JO261_05080 [Alphaproteobacteria bacterium]|nr:hypothetical protein [Alphaproteobacteria bacterium]MBV9693054.1 hypothetical protein [Alphaproteobacteria bacterium]